MQMKIDFPVLKGKRYLTIARTDLVEQRVSYHSGYQLCNSKGILMFDSKDGFALGLLVLSSQQTQSCVVSESNRKSASYVNLK